MTDYAVSAFSSLNRSQPVAAGWMHRDISNSLQSCVFAMLWTFAVRGGAEAQRYRHTDNRNETGVVAADACIDA